MISITSSQAWYRRIVLSHSFLITFILLWIYYIFHYPSLSYDSQVYSEQGTNYLVYAYNKTFAENIWKDDAGYLVWLPRLIALLVSAVVTPYQFIYVTNLIALAFMAFFVSFMNHSGFRDLLPDQCRFFLSLLFGIIILPSYEIFTFINFSYTGFIFIAFLLFLNKETLSCAQYITYSVLSALLCISKFHFVAFFPVFCVVIGWHYYRKEKRSARFYLPAIVTILIQIGHTLLMTKLQSDRLGYTVYDQGILNTLMYATRGLFFWTTAYATHFRFLGNAIVAQVIGLGVFVTLFYCAVRLYKNHDISAKIFFVFLVFNLISILFGSITSLSHWAGIAASAFRNQPFPFQRRWFISYDMVWLACAVFLCHLIFVKSSWGGGIWLNKKIYLGIFCMLLLLSFVTTWPKSRYSISAGSASALSDWKYLHVLLKNEKYFIPVNPFPFGLYDGIRQGMTVGQMSDNSYITGYTFTNKIDSFVPHYDRTSFTQEGILLTKTVFNEQKKMLSLIANYPKDEVIYALAFDEKGQFLARAEQISSNKTRYKYLIFPYPLTSYQIAFFNAADEPIGNQITTVSIYVEE